MRIVCGRCGHPKILHTQSLRRRRRATYIIGTCVSVCFCTCVRVRVRRTPFQLGWCEMCGHSNDTPSTSLGA